MKKTIIALFIFASLALQAQDKASLEKNANLAHEYTVKANYTALMDLTYPKLFELFPKEKMIEMLPQMLSGDGFSITILDTAPNFAFGEIKKVNGGAYVVIKHDTRMKMAFTEPMGDDELQEMMPLFKESLGTENITFDRPQNAFYINKRSQMIGAADKLTNNEWRFLNNDNPELLKKILSPEILKALGL